MVTRILATRPQEGAGNSSKWPILKIREAWVWSLIWKCFIQKGAVGILFPWAWREKSNYQKIHKHFPVDSTLTFEGTVEWEIQGILMCGIFCCFFCLWECGIIIHKGVSYNRPNPPPKKNSTEVHQSAVSKQISFSFQSWFNIIIYYLM